MPELYLFRCPFMTCPSMKQYKIVGVSNDLVVYGPREKVGDHCIYNMCNPITRQCISLPPYTHCPEFESIGFVTHVEDGVLSSQRVVRLEVPFQRSNIIRFLVFISETNKWKEFDVYTEREILGSGITLQHPATLNGILHWITDRNGIMAYDPYQKPDTLRFIALPRDIEPVSNDGNRGIHTLLGAHQGRLRYVESPGDHRHGASSIGVWIMNNYNSGDWRLQHRISFDDIIYDGVLPIKNLCPEPIFFHPFDPDIVYLGYNIHYISISYNIKTRKYITSYNIKTRKLEFHRGVFGSRAYICWWWTFLFVIPPWPTSIARSPSGVIV